MPGQVTLSDGTLGHENEVFWDYGKIEANEPLERNPNGWHFKDGQCDCSLDCCLRGTMPDDYDCVCDECPGDCGEGVVHVR